MVALCIFRTRGASISDHSNLPHRIHRIINHGPGSLPARDGCRGGIGTGSLAFNPLLCPWTPLISSSLTLTITVEFLQPIADDLERAGFVDSWILGTDAVYDSCEAFRIADGELKPDGFEFGFHSAENKQKNLILQVDRKN